LPGFDRIRLPGEDRAARIEERRQNGIPIPGSLKTALDTMAGELGIARLLP
jgi:LDH2 family malate/lactate/ureidoglycolate dehydrogenase